MDLNYLITFGVVYLICSISEPFIENYIKINGSTHTNRILLGFVGLIKALILFILLLKYFVPLLEDFGHNNFKFDSLSGLAIVLWVQQLIDCLSGIAKSQLKIGSWSY